MIKLVLLSVVVAVALADAGDDRGHFHSMGNNLEDSIFIRHPTFCRPPERCNQRSLNTIPFVYARPVIVDEPGLSDKDAIVMENTLS